MTDSRQAFLALASDPEASDISAVELAREARFSASARHTRRLASGVRNRDDEVRVLSTARRDARTLALFERIVDPITDNARHTDLAGEVGLTRQTVARVRRAMWSLLGRHSVRELRVMTSVEYSGIVARRQEYCQRVAVVRRRWTVPPPPPKNPDACALGAKIESLMIALNKAKGRIDQLRKRKEYQQGTAALRFLAHLTPDLLDEVEASGILRIGSGSAFVRVDVDGWQSADLARMVEGVHGYHEQARSAYEAAWRKGRGMTATKEMNSALAEELREHIEESMTAEPYPWGQAR